MKILLIGIIGLPLSLAITFLGGILSDLGQKDCTFSFGFSSGGTVCSYTWYGNIGNYLELPGFLAIFLSLILVVVGLIHWLYSKIRRRSRRS